MSRELLIFLSRLAMPAVLEGTELVGRIRKLQLQGHVVASTPHAHEEGAAIIYSLTSSGRAEVERAYLEAGGKGPPLPK